MTEGMAGSAGAAMATGVNVLGMRHVYPGNSTFLDQRCRMTKSCGRCLTVFHVSSFEE